jgi:hypothetical protein
VKPSFLGHGCGCPYGYCPCSRRKRPSGKHNQPHMYTYLTPSQTSAHTSSSFCYPTFFMQKLGIEYHDFIRIFLLLIINSTISFIKENNASNVAAALMAHLAPKAKVTAHCLSSSESNTLYNINCYLLYNLCSCTDHMHRYHFQIIVPSAFPFSDDSKKLNIFTFLALR